MIENNPLSNSSVHLPRFGLYFPYIHFRDDNWIKVAALYWPKMARIVPSGYPTHDSDTVRKLIDKIDWTVEIPPEDARKLVVPIFEDFVDELDYVYRVPDPPRGHPHFQARPHVLDDEEIYRWLPGHHSIDVVEAEPSNPPNWGAGPGEAPFWRIRSDYRLAGMYLTEFEPALCRRLIKSGFAQPALAMATADGTTRTLEFDLAQINQMISGPASGKWLIMHRDLAWIYKCLLCETLASHNRLALTTDQVDAHAAASGLSSTQLALGGVTGKAVAGDLATAFGLTAIQTIIPKDLAGVPIDKIITIRKRYGGEFDSWRHYIDRVGIELAEQLTCVESPRVLRTYLDEAARKYAEAPVDRLRKGITSVGVDVISAALNTKFEAPAAIAATGLATGNPVAVAAGAAVGIAELRRSTKRKAQAELASPNSYLLNILETLEPQSWVKRVMASMRAAAGLRG